MSTDARHSKIRIVSVPPGDAPLWVREKWVGLELPLRGRRSKTRSVGVSVLVRPTLLHHIWAMLRGQTKTVTGYRVDAKQAVDILAVSSPEAAAWWQQNTPGLLRWGRKFVFHGEACEVIAGK